MTEQIPQMSPAGEPVAFEVVAGPGSAISEPMVEHQPPPGAETSIHEPAKVMRIGSMIKQLLDEVRAAPLDNRSRIRLREIFETSVRELSTALSPDLQDELRQLALPFHDDDVPSDAELRIAQAQLVGWLEGLFHGIQATLVAQQMAAQAQLQQMRGRGLPPGPGSAMQQGPVDVPGAEDGRPGTYL